MQRRLQRVDETWRQGSGTSGKTCETRALDIRDMWCSCGGVRHAVDPAATHVSQSALPLGGMWLACFLRRRTSVLSSSSCGLPHFSGE